MELKLMKLTLENFFKIYVGDSNDDNDIKEIRFSSDDEQNGNPTGKWTNWYSWDASSGDWNASTKIKMWSFATSGNKEVWAEVKDDIDQTDRVSANITAQISVSESTPTLAEIIKQESTERVPVTVDDQQYFIVTLESYIDPKTLKCSSVSHPVKAYVDNEGNPVSEIDIVQKIGQIEVTRECEVDLHERSKQLEALRTKVSNVSGALMVAAGYNTIVGSVVDIMSMKERLEFLEWVGVTMTKWEEIKDLAIKKPPKSLITRVAVVGLKKLFGDPIDEVKNDILREISQAINSYNSVQNINNKEITDYESARSFLKGRYYGEAHEEAARFLNDKIFRNWGLALLEFEPITGALTSDLSKFIKLAINAAAVTDWTVDINYRYACRVYEIEAKVSYALTDNGKYTLELAQASGKISDYQQKYFQHINDGKIEAAKIPQGAYDYLHGFDLKEFFSSVPFIKIHSSGELRVYDAQGRITGVINGKVKEEIPNSIYEETEKTVVIFNTYDSYTYEVEGIDEGVYGLDITFFKDGDATTFFGVTDIPTVPREIHQYSIDWAALSKGGKEVTKNIDSDGDGIFERTFLTTLPNTPSNPSPSDRVTGISINTDLIWTSSNPDDDKMMTYEIYFGTDEILSLEETTKPYSATQTSIVYDPGQLRHNTTYYWKIRVINSDGITAEGPTWSFTTGSWLAGQSRTVRVLIYLLILLALLVL